MNFSLKINGSESGKAAYVGWAPLKCTLTIDGYLGQTLMPVSITTGHDGKKGRLSLYTSSAISSTPVKKIKHDFKTGNEISFYIAGEYPNASEGEKDTYITVESQGKEVPPLTINVMVRIRKNANKLSANEIENFLSAFIKLNKKSPINKYDEGQNTYTPKNILDEIVLMHTYDASSEIHRRTSFHPWHRLFLCHLERELQEENPAVTVPYWRYDKGADFVFTQEFIGETLLSNGVTTEDRFLLAPKPKFSSTNPLYTYSTIFGPLIRGYRNQNPLTHKPSASISSQKEIVATVTPVSNVYRVIGDNVSSDRFKGWAYKEEGNSHNPAHDTFDGRICDVGRDPVDPLFFMMHGNVDRLWALWQRKYNRLIPTHIDTYPFQGKFASGKNPKEAPWNQTIGNFLQDTLWPWNFDHNPTRPAREWDLTEEGLDYGKVPDIDIPFPNSEITHYPGQSPTLESTIDYQGRTINEENLGYDYDDIPYFDHNGIDFEGEETIMKKMDVNNEVFLNKTARIEERLKSADLSNFQDGKFLPSLFEILEDNIEDERIRVRALGLIDTREESFLAIGLKIINDEKSPVVLRIELIHAVFTAKRSNPNFGSIQPEFFNILRGLLQNEETKLRFQAIKSLVESGDEIVQEFLVEEALKDESVLISRKDALDLLAQNTKPQHAQLFRKLFNQSRDPEVKKAAIEGLGNDPDSVELLKKVVLDKSEQFKVREAGALSLHHLDHRTMNELATQIITELPNTAKIKFLESAIPDPEEVDFKAGLLNMLTYTADLNQLKQNNGLKMSLKQVIDPLADDKISFKSTLEAFTALPLKDPTVIEQMAAKLLNILDNNENK